MMQRDDIWRIRCALEDNAVSFVSFVYGDDPTSVTRRHAFWGNTNKFKLDLTGPKRGLYVDYSNTGRKGRYEGGSLLDLIANRITNGDFKDAVKYARDWLGWGDDAPPPPKPIDVLRLEREERAKREQAKQEADNQAKLNEALRIWNNSTPIEGTIAERYLQNARAIPANAWPSSIRWNEELRLLVCAVTNVAGDVVAIQRTALTQDAQKDFRWTINSKPKAKLSLAQIGDNVVVLPGDKDGWLVDAEGLETGLSAWAAGYDVRVALGGRLVKPPRGRRVIHLRDDDKYNPTKEAARRSVIQEWVAEGIDIIEVYPFETRRYEGEDFNTLLQEQGIDAVRARIEEATRHLEHTEFLFPLEAAQKRLKDVVDKFFDAADNYNNGARDTQPPVYGAGVTVGGGKTEETLNASADYLHKMRQAGDKRAVVFAVPEHRLSGEIAERFNNIAQHKGYELKAEIWRGREARLPKGDIEEHMCGQLDVVREAQSLWADIDNEICGKCELKDNCAYLTQRRNDGDLWIVAHNMLFSQAPSVISNRGVAVLVVDESPWQAGLIGVENKGIELVLDSLMPAAKMAVPGGIEGQRLIALRENLAIVFNGREDGYITRDAIKSAGFISDSASWAAKAEWQRKQDKRHEKDWRAREANKSLGVMSALWNAIDHLMNTEGVETSGRLKLAHTKEQVRIIRIRGRKDIASEWIAPTLCIDALLDVELLRHYWPNIEDKGTFSISAPYQIIEQAAGYSWAKSYLDPSYGNGDTPKKQAMRRKAKAAILKTADRIGGDVLVVGNKKIIHALNLPPHFKTAWFGNVAGRDEWRDVDGIIILGRPLPTAEEAERMAGALTGIAPMSVGTERGRYQRKDDYRLKRNGRAVLRLPVEGQAHPDPIAERIREHVCAGQITQAIGRGRGVRRDAHNPLKVVVLTDTVLKEPVDRFISNGEVEPTKRELMLAEGGVAFEDGAAAAGAYDFFKSANYASKTLRAEAGSREGLILLDIPNRNSPPLRAVRFQLAGARRKPQFAEYDPRHCSDPRGFIEARLGPLALCEVQGQGEIAEPLPVAVGDYVASEQAPTYQIHRAIGRSTGLAVALAISERCDLAEAIIVAQEVISEPDTELDPDTEPDTELAAHIDWPKVETLLRDGGQTYGELAKRLEVSPFHLSNIKSGRRRATRKIADGVEAFLREAVPAQGRLF